ncbi:MAG: GGDEF domain-containing protein [Pseudobutyrivibrio sp.]|nr:GGDEF domain-containing protein [Pseudobutyrivibrio sp.]
MDKGFIQKICVLIYIALILFIEMLGFAYSNQESGDFAENFIVYHDGWAIDGVDVNFPFDAPDTFRLTNTLPVVYEDQFLILTCFYDTYTVYVDGKEVMRSWESRLFNSTSDVGKKEIHVPMKKEYSGKEVVIYLNLQDSLYGAEVYHSFISTRSGYCIYLLKKNWLQLSLAVVLFFVGACEVIFATYFIFKKSKIVRKISFEALLYAGVFEITSSIWLICQSRLLYNIFGNGTGFGVLEIIVFLMMPLAFFELIRAANFRVSKTDNVVDGIIAIGILLLFIFCLVGLLDWGQIVTVGHFIDLVVFVIASYYSYTSIRETKKLSERRVIAIGNIGFLLICFIAIAMYINDLDSPYNVLIVFALLIYISTQVGLIYRRISIKVEQEAELVQAKEFAYTDELTHLTNRRYLYEELSLMDDKTLLPDTTVVYLDVNRLKYYNDNYGHGAGAELLIATADCLREAFEDSSTSVISRIGGDEFIIMLIASDSELRRRIDKFYKLSSNWKGKYVEGFTVSIGVATSRDYPNASAEELCKYADDKMLADKAKFYSRTEFERRKN